MEPQEILALDSQEALPEEIVAPDATVPKEVPEETTKEDVQPDLPGIETGAQPVPDDGLRQMLREMRRENALMKEKLEKLTAVATSEEGTVDMSVPGELELLQAEIRDIGEKNGVMHETLLEVMEANPTFADVRTVCTRDNLDDIIEAAATNIVKKDGGNYAVVAAKLEKELWSERNPYRKMYELIKAYHPKYQQKPADTPATPGRAPKPVVAPTSLASLGGGDSNLKSGWTAEKIDNMPETELSKVPADIYEQYLAGTLD